MWKLTLSYSQIFQKILIWWSHLNVNKHKQTGVWKKQKKIVFNHMQVSMQRIKNVCLKLADLEVRLSSYETKIWFTLLCPHLALICLS